MFQLYRSSEAIASDIRARVFSGELPALHALTETEVASSYERCPAHGQGRDREARGGRAAGQGSAQDRPRGRPWPGVRARHLPCPGLPGERSAPAAGIQPDRARTEAVRANNDIAALKTGAPLDVVEPDMRFHTSLVDALGNQRISKMYLSLVGEVRLLSCPGCSHCTCSTRPLSRRSTRSSSNSFGGGRRCRRAAPGPIPRTGPGTAGRHDGRRSGPRSGAAVEAHG